MRFLFIAALLTGCHRPSAPPTRDAGPLPPNARRTPVTTTLHGDTRVDEYAWMKEKGRLELEAHLRAENAYTEAMLLPQAGLREQLEAELLSRRPRVVDDFPEQRGGFEYWNRSDLTEQFPHLMWRALDGGPDTELLDLNALATDASYVNLLDTDPSDDGARLAWAIDTSGSRNFALHVTELDGGTLWPFSLEHVTSFAWAADGQTLFFTTENAASRSDKLLRLDPGADAGVVVFEEKDEHFDVSVRRSDGRHRYLVREVGSLTTNEVAVLDARAPKGRFEVVLPRVQGQRSSLHEGADDFVVLSEDQGAEGRVVTLPIKNPVRGKRVEVVPRRLGVPIQSLSVFAKYLVVWERIDGQLRARALDWATRKTQSIDGAGFFSPTSQGSFEGTRFLYELDSPAQPSAVFERELVSGETKKRWEYPVEGFDASRFEVLRLSAAAKDGTSIPITLARMKGVGPHAPLLLEGYGAYGDPTGPGFSRFGLALLERGVVLAYAHVRGGGEFGDAWHDGGKLANKFNTFTDFIACAEHLVHEDQTLSSRLIITGGSAGGLLMGAVLNLRPELFHAAYVEVPFVDVINTMLDTSLPLTVGEFEEWGDPREKDQYAWMKAYSPYDNVSAQAYPSMLVRSAYNDTQVLFHEPAKWVQRVRAMKADDRQVLLWMSMEPAGHGGRTALADVTKDEAKSLSWLLSQWGVSQ